MVFASYTEGRFIRIPELLEQGIGQNSSRLKPAGFTCDVIESEQPFDEIGVVFQIAIQFALAIFVGAEQQPVIVTDSLVRVMTTGQGPDPKGL